MASVNRATILGNLGKDPEIRNTNSGMKIVNLTVATFETWNDKASGERKEQTEWHRVVIMNDRLADVAERFLRKGSKVYLEGKIQTRKWTDQSGQDRYSTEIVLGRFGAELVLLDKRDEGAPTPNAASRPASPAARPSAQPGSAAVYDDLDDQIPF